MSFEVWGVRAYAALIGSLPQWGVSFLKQNSLSLSVGLAQREREREREMEGGREQDK